MNPHRGLRTLSDTRRFPLFKNAFLNSVSVSVSAEQASALALSEGSRGRRPSRGLL